MRAACLLDAAGLEAVTASRGSGTGGRRRKAPRRCHCHVTTNDRSPRERTERGPAPPRGRVMPVPRRTTRRPDTTGHRPPETTRSARPGARPGNVSANAAPRDGGEALRDERMPPDGLAQARCRRQTPLTTGTTLFRQRETPRGQRESGAAPTAPPETCVSRSVACQGLVGPAVYTINTHGRNTRASLGVPGARAPSSLHCAS